MLRLNGRTCNISSKDLQTKEQALMSENSDRTVRCIEVLQYIGICSSEDFDSQNPHATLYKLVGTTSYMPLNEQDLTEAVRRMKSVPLLMVFHVGLNYEDYILKFQQRPVLSYKEYEEGRMRGHAVCAVGYGVESIVSFWKFMNSCGKMGPTKGFGRVLPQNVYYLIAPNGLKVVEPENAPPPRAAQNLKRIKSHTDDEADTDAQSMKKRKKLRLNHR